LYYVSLTNELPDKVYSLSKLVENETKIKNRIKIFREKYAWTESKKGFRIKIGFGGNDFGILEVDDVKFPKYKEHYLNLTLSITNVCGLAIENARRHQTIKESEKKLRQGKKQLELLATTDSLTGLLNRRSFIERIERETIRQRRSGKTFSVVMSDIDNFKNINDSYGHPFGDSVLIKFADTFRVNIRDQDSVSRWGGEEFILLLSETDLKGALVLSEKIRKKLESLDNWFEGKRVTVTATFGISECQSQDNYLESIKKADQALYEGKKAGRNCIMPGHKI